MEQMFSILSSEATASSAHDDRLLSDATELDASFRDDLRMNIATRLRESGISNKTVGRDVSGSVLGVSPHLDIQARKSIFSKLSQIPNCIPEA